MAEQLEKLIAHYQKAIVIKHDNAVVHSKLGNLYATQNKFESASYHYIKAIQIEPNYLQIYYQLRFTLLNLNRFGAKDNSSLLKLGISTIREIIKNQPDFIFASVVLGVLLAQQGKTEEAISCYQAASYKQILSSHPQLVKESWDQSQKRQPDFLILGFPKCGTTSLYAYLTSHPQILPAVSKELLYFTHSERQGIDYYLAHFPSISDTNYLTGEASPNYITFPSVAKRVFEWFPNINLIVLLRNPAEHAISSYYWQNRFACKSGLIEHKIIENIEKMPSILNKFIALLKLDLEPSAFIKYGLEDKWWLNNKDEFLPSLLGSLYVYYLEGWLNVFPKEQFLILKSEDLFNNPSETLKRTYDFLNLPDYPLPEYRNFNPNSYPPISSDIRRQLVEFFRPYNQQLEEYLGMKFNWQ
jgi:tetratricopeptide (TPR) repeat protein